MKKPLKRLSIFSVLFFFVFTLDFACYSYGDTTPDNFVFLTQNTYQGLSNHRTLCAVFIDTDIISSFTFLSTTSDRAPPEPAW